VQLGSYGRHRKRGRRALGHWRSGQLRPEAELLLYSARTGIEAHGVARISALVRGDVDWTSLLQMALQHGTTPLLYWHLSRTCPDAVPEAILAQLRHQFYANAGHNVRLARELVRLLQLFGAQGIPAVPFKGPALAAFAYGNLAFRQFGDLDILVPQRDFASAKELLLSQAYVPGLGFTGPQEAAYLQSQRASLFVHRDRSTSVDLHIRITRRQFPCLLDPEEVWKRAELVSLEGAIVRHPSPEDLLLILCVHGAKHAWGRLQWICDVAALVRAHPRLDWHGVMEQAGRLGSARMLLLGLRLAHDLLGAVLPVRMMEGTQADPSVPRLASRVREHLLSERGIPLHTAGWPVFHLRVRERGRDRVPYLLFCLGHYASAVVTPNARDVALLPLPAALSCVYYLLRPIRVVRKYGLRPSTYRDLLRHS
jgi:hypothetical protein